MKKYALVAAIALAAITTSAAQAAPFKFTFTSAISNSSGPDASEGDTFVLTVLADNGGSSISDQTWDYGSLLSFTLDVGTYHASYSKAYESSTGFTTDGSGNVSSVGFYGTSDFSQNSDNFGPFNGDYLYGNGAFVDSLGNFNNLDINMQDPSAWSVSAVGGAVPEPASWALMLGGFGMVGGAMRSRRKAAVSFG